jgi:Glycosyl hydrolase catalytic core
VKRLVRLVAVACAVAAVLPAAAPAAQRMWMGFQDDPAFLYRSDRQYNFDRAKNAYATVLVTTLDWGKIAPRRPARPADPFDPAYRWEGMDEFVRSAQSRGIEPMFRLYGTPRWAGPRRNALPRRLGDVTLFARAAALRYSGRYPGFPFVRFWGVWNEPNLNQFLTPQFDRRGRDVAPQNYARLYAAAYAGIKGANRAALVSIGDTSARGRDRRKQGLQDTHSPGRFMELVAKANPRLRFDAFAHHPYPTDPHQPPEQIVRWPNVSLKSLPRMEKSLNKWFHRRSTPIWITEYSHETVPDKRGISYALQADYLRRAITIARGYPYVGMFIWFVLHDDEGDPWQSGLVTEDNVTKPAFQTWAQLVYGLDARNAVTVVPGGRANPTVRISALSIAARSPAGARLGVDERVVQGDSLVAHAQPEATLAVDGWVTVPIHFTPARGRIYYAYVTLNDIHGNTVSRLLTLVGR